MARILEDGCSFSGFERDKLYLSDRGERFVDISGLSGLDAVSDGRGAAYADFDNDGDSDIFLTSLQGQAPPSFPQRGRTGPRVPAGHPLHGRESGRDAYGAEVRVKTSQGVLARIKAGGSGFVSQSDPRLLFGLGKDESAEWLEVRWPSGTTQRFNVVAVRSSVLVRGGTPKLEYLREHPLSLPDPLAADTLVRQAVRPQPGDPFPSLPLTDLRGKTLKLDDLTSSGRPLVVNLWVGRR